MCGTPPRIHPLSSNGIMLLLLGWAVIPCSFTLSLFIPGRKPILGRRRTVISKRKAFPAGWTRIVRITVDRTDTLSSTRMANICRLFMKRYHFRPAYIARNLLQTVKSAEEGIRSMKAGWNFLKHVIRQGD